MQPHRRTLQGAPPGRVQEVHRRGTRHCPRRARRLHAAYGGGTEVRRDQAGGRVPLWHVLGRPLRLLSRPGQGQQPVLPWARAIRSSRFLALLSARNNGLAVRSGSPGPEQAGQTLFRRDHALRVLQPQLVDLAYAAAMRFWSYPILLILVVAALRTGRYGNLRPTST